MTRENIKNLMLKKINACLEEQIHTYLEDYITEEMVEDFLWSKDYGLELIQEYLEENATDYIEDYLECIYDEIEASELN